MKKHLSTIILIAVLVVGLAILLYPTISDYWNSLHQSKAIASYVEEVSNMDEDQYQQMLDQAIRFNDQLNKESYALTDEQKAEYEQILNPGNLGIMAYVEVPSLGIALPIYHGTEESVLQRAVGHMEWTSLPVGGKSTHCVISGHRGLPSAKLFTDLDKMKEQDIFIIRVLDEILTYQVDQILIVEPHDVQALRITEGMDYCTMVTCTPYGVNSHRLLIRGHRIENLEDTPTTHIAADAMQIDPLIMAPIIATPILLVLLILLFTTTKKKR